MSRARDWDHPVTGERIWFNITEPEATIAQLEALADVEGTDIDDLIDARLSQKAVHYRLHLAMGKVPTRVTRRHTEMGQYAAVCRICSMYEEECEGRITRHHFVPRWIMLELSDYQRYAPRAHCTIPICAGKHRQLHRREQDGPSKSIVPYLTPYEKDLAETLVRKLKEERPALYKLIASGDASSYEYTLIRDWQLGRFHSNKFVVAWRRVIHVIRKYSP